MLKHYRVLELQGGDEYAENMKELKEALIDTFFKRLDLESKTWFKVKRSLRQQLKMHVEKLSQKDTLIREGFLKQSDLLQISHTKLQEDC